MNQKSEILHSYIQQYSDSAIFLHNTREKEIADLICREGFIFENQLAHSTDRINPNELIETTYFLYQRKEYGHYTILIAIPKKTYNLYVRYSNQIDIPVEELITVAKSKMGDNDELIYVLPPQHIAGYFDIISNEFIRNPEYDPAFISYRDREDF